MDFELFFKQLQHKPISISADNTELNLRDSLDNEALFQLPFICMVILAFAKDRRKPLVSSLGQLVGECLELSIPSFKGSSQHLGWSSNLRVRTVKALDFLELAELVTVDNRNSHVAATELGRKVVDKALKNESDLASNLSRISREYRNISVMRQLDLELTK